jgi:hypothetical protein
MRALCFANQKIDSMPSDRANMTVRVMPLASPEAGDSRVGGTPSERVALVRTLSAAMWARTQRPLPTYQRATMPVTVVTRRSHHE